MSYISNRLNYVFLIAVTGASFVGGSIIACIATDVQMILIPKHEQENFYHLAVYAIDFFSILESWFSPWWFDNKFREV